MRGYPRFAICLVLLVIILTGWSLRLFGLDWDQGYGLHPDERYITWIAASLRLSGEPSDLFHPDRTGLNPYRWPPDGRPPEERSRPFSYGHLPLYLLALTAGGDSAEERLALVGRVLSALFDTATIVLTFALGRLLFSVAAGVLAAAFVALTVLHIQLAHYATFDTVLTFFVVATLLFVARFVRHKRRRDSLVAGICLGGAIGSKFSAVLLLVPLLVAYALYWEGLARRHFRRLTGLFALSIAVAFLTFAVTNPFSIIQPDVFISNLSDQTAMLRGDDGFPFTLQYRGTLPYVYPIEQQLRWGMGVPLGLIAFAGLGYAIYRVYRFPIRAEIWIPLIWTVLYFGLFGSMHVKFMRYMLPLLPVLAIYGAWLVHSIAEHIRKSKNQRLPFPRGQYQIGLAISGLVILPTILYALAFLNVFRGDHPWLCLSRWIYAHIPVGATIAYEKWDHHLPLTIYQGERMRWPGEFRQLVLDPSAPDTNSKLRKMLEQLAASDYIIVASNRLYGSLSRLPQQYPLMQRYYEHLFDGQMGFQLVPLPEIERHPQLGPFALVADTFGVVDLSSPFRVEKPAPLTLNLGRADESFTVYDHPRPLLFQNTGRLSATGMEGLFSDLLGVSDS